MPLTVAAALAVSGGCGDGGAPSSARATATAPAAAGRDAPARDALDVRAKRRCLAEAGFRTTARRRKPGDDDAPDVRLLLMERGAQAFVALYTDVRRARRFEPKIRQNVKAFGGSVERRGNVTIAWVRRPHGAALTAARDCLFA